MLSRLTRSNKSVVVVKWQNKQTTMMWGQCSVRHWNSPQSHYQSFNLIMYDDIGRQSIYRVVISFISNSSDDVSSISNTFNHFCLIQFN